MTDSNTHSRQRLALLASTVPALAEHYTDLLAFGWRRRADRLNDPTLAWRDLLESDDRLQAALEALLRLGKYARAHLMGSLAQPIAPAQLFALTLYALAAQDDSLLEACRDLVSALPDLRHAFAAAFEWAPPSAFLQTCIEALPPAPRMQAVAMRYRDFPGLADRTLDELGPLEPTPENVRALCTLIRHLGRDDLVRVVLGYLDDEQEEVRLSIVQTALTVAPGADRDAVLRTLRELINSRIRGMREAAVRLAILHEPGWSPDLLDWLKRQSNATRLYLLALGWSGEAHAVPALMEHLSNTQHARLAAASLALIVGSIPARDGWAGPTRGNTPAADAGDDQIPDPDLDRNLPWPDAAGFAGWWRSRCSLFDPGLRYLAGRPIELPWLAELLMSGPLPWRLLAAEHRQALVGGPLFPVGLCAAAQRALFHELA